MRQGNRQMGQPMGQPFPQPALMGRVGVGMQQADRDAFDRRGPQLLGQPIDIGIGQGNLDAAIRPSSFPYAEPAVPGHQ